MPHAVTMKEACRLLAKSNATDSANDIPQLLHSNCIAQAAARMPYTTFHCDRAARVTSSTFSLFLADVSKNGMSWLSANSFACRFLPNHRELLNSR